MESLEAERNYKRSYSFGGRGKQIEKIVRRLGEPGRIESLKDGRT
jgi:hypothetical protein